MFVLIFYGKYFVSFRTFNEVRGSDNTGHVIVVRLRTDSISKNLDLGEAYGLWYGDITSVKILRDIYIRYHVVITSGGLLIIDVVGPLK